MKYHSWQQAKRRFKPSLPDPKAGSDNHALGMHFIYILPPGSRHKVLLIYLLTFYNGAAEAWANTVSEFTQTVQLREFTLSLEPLGHGSEVRKSLFTRFWHNPQLCAHNQGKKDLWYLQNWVQTLKRVVC